MEISAKNRADRFALKYRFGLFATNGDQRKSH